MVFSYPIVAHSAQFIHHVNAYNDLWYMRLSRPPRQTNCVAGDIQRPELPKMYTTPFNDYKERNNHSSHAKEKQYKARPPQLQCMTYDECPDSVTPRRELLKSGSVGKFNETIECISVSFA